jgi:hypothetical protein
VKNSITLFQTQKLSIRTPTLTLRHFRLQANIVSIKIYLAEILPIDRRGFYVVLPDLFWTAGYFSTSGTIPVSNLSEILLFFSKCATFPVFIYYFGSTNANVSEHQGMDMRLTSWRIIFAVGGGLCITMGCTSALLEMSPRYLLFKRRIITASLILKQFYAINKSKYSETFDVSQKSKSGLTISETTKS